MPLHFFLPDTVINRISNIRCHPYTYVISLKICFVAKLEFIQDRKNRSYAYCSECCIKLLLCNLITNSFEAQWFKIKTPTMAL